MRFGELSRLRAVIGLKPQLASMNTDAVTTGDKALTRIRTYRGDVFMRFILFAGTSWQRVTFWSVSARRRRSRFKAHAAPRTEPTLHPRCGS